MLTVDQAASQLQVSRSLVYSLIEAGKLKCHRIGTGRGTIRLSPADIELFLASCRKHAQSESSNKNSACSDSK